jgi:AcrR family transcriptional regulator
MFSTMASAKKPARRRTQAERSDATRARVIEAAVACVAEEGFRATQLTGIARRAGVTTGAIQHHFGDKLSVLAAVVEHGFDDLETEVAELRAGGEAVPGPALPSQALPERVARFVETLWRRYLGAASRASIEILIHLRSDPEFRGRALPTLARVRNAIDAMWMGLFRDSAVPRERHVAAQRLLFTTLNGLALERILLADGTQPHSDLDLLIERIVDLLE